jgi:hypothetical protein
MTLTPHTDAVSCIALSEFNNNDSDGHNSNSTTNTGIRGIFIVTGSDDANVGVMFLASPPHHPGAMLGCPPPMHMLGIQRPLVLHMLCGHDDLITGVAVAAGT